MDCGTVFAVFGRAARGVSVHPMGELAAGWPRFFVTLFERWQLKAGLEGTVTCACANTYGFGTSLRPSSRRFTADYADFGRYS